MITPTGYNVIYLFTGTKRKHTNPPAVSPYKVDLGSIGYIDISGCGDIKGCLFVPDDCVYGTNCDVLVTWQDQPNLVHFEMDYVIDPAHTNVWAALGFSDDTQMVTSYYWYI